MTREIKFRAWDKQEKKMRDWEYCKTIYTLFWLEDGLLGMNEIMQFTGLTDKNGKEIYEGDILKNHASGEWRHSQILYDAEEAAYVLEEQHMFVSYVLQNEYLFEVIGNIYDNPELIH